ncbi:uncharacterized protein LOC135385485 [Ornithodoros turicata]|uniref:uncharacterized protein LOC135378663 n=1 Tax=Ornithodoros turicata TaxID=34597 RepID=UPI003138641A
MAGEKRGRYKLYLEPSQERPKVPRQTLFNDRRRASVHPASSGLQDTIEDEVEGAQTPENDESCGSCESDSDDLNDISDQDELDDLLATPRDISAEEEFEDRLPTAPNPNPLREEDNAEVDTNVDAEFEDILRDYGDEKLPYQNTTVLQGLLLILTYVVSAGLSWSQVDLLLKLINALLGKDVFPNSKYGFRKLWNLRKKGTMNMHYFCGTCNYEMLPVSTDIGAMLQCKICSRKTTEQVLIREGKFFVTLDLRRQLQHLLRHTGTIVGSNLQRIASSQRSSDCSDITDGALYHETRQRFCMTSDDLTLTINTDGSPVFKSSKSSVWPIQVMLNELSVLHRWRHIIVAGLWFAKEHPPTHLFMKAFVDEVIKVGTIAWTYGSTLVRSRIFPILSCVDSPARAALLNHKQYNGYYGCPWCMQQGTIVEGIIKYPYEEDVIERTHDLVVHTMKAAAREGRVIDGIKGLSPLVKLSSLDLVWGFPPDYLHCVLEGVTAQLTDLWLTTTGAPWYIGNKLQLLNDRIALIHPPLTFTRLPRGVSEKALWKATEWKYWLLYYALPCLQGVLPDRFLRHFALLSHSTYLLLKKTVTERDIAQASKLLKTFVQQVSALYGEAAATFNVHQLLHLAKSVRLTGPLWATSTFPFEGGNGGILKLVSAAKGVPMQVTERCVMQQALEYLTRVTAMPPRLETRRLQISATKTKSYETHVLGSPVVRPGALENFVLELFQRHFGTLPEITEFFRARIHGFVLHSATYTRTEKTCSQYIQGASGDYYRVMHIFSVKEEIILVCQRLLTSEAFGVSYLHRCEHPPQQEGLCLLFKDDICALCIHIQQKTSCFVADIPNDYETD